MNSGLNALHTAAGAGKAPPPSSVTGRCFSPGRPGRPIALFAPGGTARSTQPSAAVTIPTGYSCGASITSGLAGPAVASLDATEVAVRDSSGQEVWSSR